MNRPYDWLLFDADDTLFDYQRAESAALQATFQQFALPFDGSTLALYRMHNHDLWLALERGEITGESLRHLRFQRLSAALQLQFPPELSDAYIDNLAAQAILNDGALDTLQSLARHYQCAIITNGMSRVQRPRLACSPLRPFVSGLVISEEVGFAKPAPGIFDAAFAQMNHPARDRVLMIGDSLSSDMLGGISYQIDTCWYNPNRLAPPQNLKLTREIHNLRELCDWLA